MRRATQLLPLCGKSFLLANTFVLTVATAQQLCTNFYKYIRVYYYKFAHAPTHTPTRPRTSAGDIDAGQRWWNRLRRWQRWQHWLCGRVRDSKFCLFIVITTIYAIHTHTRTRTYVHAYLYPPVTYVCM